MEHFIVDMQTEKSKKYYFIREEVSQEIVLLPSQYLMHKMRAKGSPNTIKRSALVISYYLNYLSENQLTMEDVPFMLYEVMQQYIKKNHIHANDYVFQAEQGGAYRIGSFVKRFRTQCKKHKIADCEYVFKTHDYRHTLATQFYDDGVPIQTIRDYLGHVAEEMTKQYVDYMPKKIEKANDNYFDKPENNIALTITPKKRRYRHEKG